MDNDFKGVWIPREIWLAKELSLQEKVFLSEIASLDNNEGCYASNKYFAEFFSLTHGRCSQIIKSLEKKGFINIEYVYGKNKEVEKRVIKVVNKLNTPIKYSKGGVKNIKPPYLENDEENNPSINNTFNINNIYSDLFNHWNEKGIIKHREMNQKMKSHTNARLDKYSKEELMKAIDNYKQVLDSPVHYWTHKWTYGDFMKPNNVTRFVDEADPLNNFLDNSKQKKQPVALGYDPSKDAF